MDEEKADMAGRKDGACPARMTVADGGPTWAQELLDHLRPTGRDIRRVVAWLADAVQGTASLQDGTGRLLAGTPTPLDDTLLADLVSGRIASAAWDDTGRHLRLVGVEQPQPAPVGVLAVSRPAPCSRGSRLTRGSRIRSLSVP